MKIITRALSGAALGVGLLCTALSGAAVADATGRATPSVVGQGESVVFFVQCETTTAASATLFGTTLGLSARIPMSEAQAAGSFNTEITVPSGTLPGHYELSMDCSDGSSTTAGVTVASRSGPHTGGGGLALAGRETATDSGNGTTLGWALAGGVLAGGVVIAAVVRRRRDRRS